MTTLNLEELRKQIDNIDEKIQTLITQRAEIAQSVARAKYAQEAQPNFYRPEREADILLRVIERNQKNQPKVLPDESLTPIFREIISACLSLQKPLKVAYLGPQGTYSQAATAKHFGHGAHTVPVQTIEEVFREVETDRAQYGVVPVENSTEGGVNQTLDCFMSSDLKICGEIELPIHHCLLSQSGDITRLVRVYSHQQSLAQCRSWLSGHLPAVNCIAVSSNAEAARRAAEEPDTAAIAGITAAERYHLQVVKANIEDYPQNTTRFAVLGKHFVPRTGRDKSSFLLSAAQSNHSGALLRLLKPFSDNGLNLTRIESRPSRQNLWEYVFFIDLDGHIEDEAVKTALDLLTTHASLVKHLGSYPRAIA
ncbi:prephenate dehydratase [Thioflexithrix psekupsensis]|uniref:Bifunctional chorismate mutase/prephenate dehydratase n=1 Tax=Thioflexithrix psekupsensis TaxID=1570016 RepID=A0A251XAA6_9GAMM|nr:prephenate dehydratase [Thioflexithrix psekupsensis]OUD15243.1 chorismate mutase [Thioflexithrix psekupsensis]